MLRSVKIEASLMRTTRGFHSVIYNFSHFLFRVSAFFEVNGKRIRPPHASPCVYSFKMISN